MSAALPSRPASRRPRVTFCHARNHPLDNHVRHNHSRRSPGEALDKHRPNVASVRRAISRAAGPWPRTPRLGQGAPRQGRPPIPTQTQKEQARAGAPVGLTRLGRNQLAHRPVGRPPRRCAGSSSLCRLVRGNIQCRHARSRAAVWHGLSCIDPNPAGQAPDQLVGSARGSRSGGGSRRRSHCPSLPPRRRARRHRRARFA